VIEEETSAVGSTITSLVSEQRLIPTVPKFEPKSCIFNEIRNDYLANSSKLPQIKKNKINIQLLLKISNLFLNYENYYTTMLVPMSDNFSLKPPPCSNSKQTPSPEESASTLDELSETNHGDTNSGAKQFPETCSFKRLKKHRDLIAFGNQMDSSDDDANNDHYTRQNEMEFIPVKSLSSSGSSSTKSLNSSSNSENFNNSKSNKILTLFRRNMIYSIISYSL
jgi:hypothetical protein